MFIDTIHRNTLDLVRYQVWENRIYCALKNICIHCWIDIREFFTVNGLIKDGGYNFHQDDNEHSPVKIRPAWQVRVRVVLGATVVGSGYWRFYDTSTNLICYSTDKSLLNSKIICNFSFQRSKMSFKRNLVAAKRVLSFDASIFVGWWYSNEICYID